MLELLNKLCGGFFPFQDMRDVKQLVLTPEHYYFFVEKLNLSLEKGMEDGGVITVYRNDCSSKIDEIYVAPEEFKTSKKLKIGVMDASEWYSNLLKGLVRKKQRIGYYWHTHDVITYGKEVHEEASTAKRTRDFLLEELLGAKERKLSVARRRMGDIIIEMLEGNKVHLHGYTPTTDSYYDEHPVHGLRWRETHSLEIVVPELGLRFDSSVYKKQKLVRDKIPEIIDAAGKKAFTHVAEDQEYANELMSKLQEEVDEFKEKHETEELADIVEVVHAISEFCGTPVEKLEKIRKEKAEKRGGFRKRLIWEQD